MERADVAKSRKLEEAFERLERARREPREAESLELLRAGLADRSSHVAARAAQIAGEHELAALVPALAAAFERFLVNGAKSDPGCAAKTAVVEALSRIGAAEPVLFLRGVRHVQLEPVWGGRADTAVGLRCASAFALVTMGYGDALVPLAELLADPEPRARAAAARALGHRELESGVPLLRLKALVGDAEPEVLSECFTALLAIAPAESVEFLARFLDPSASEQTRETAALALGGSRRREAFAPLRSWFEASPQDAIRRTALVAIAMLKSDEALDFLLALVAEAPGPTARLAIEALALHRYDDALVARVRRAAARDDVDLRETLAAEIG
jgi:HEAT repeat protein